MTAQYQLDSSELEPSAESAHTAFAGLLGSPSQDQLVAASREARDRFCGPNEVQTAINTSLELERAGVPHWIGQADDPYQPVRLIVLASDGRLASLDPCVPEASEEDISDSVTFTTVDKLRVEVEDSGSSTAILTTYFANSDPRVEEKSRTALSVFEPKHGREVLPEYYAYVEARSLGRAEEADKLLEDLRKIWPGVDRRERIAAKISNIVMPPGHGLTVAV